jgi:hypothetical protein
VEVIGADTPNFPAEPQQWIDTDPTILQALADAMESVDSASSRYALGCLQLRGKEGSIAATDGRHLLKQSGFTFPFEEEVLIHGCKLFGSKELTSGEQVQIGITESHVAFRVGAWTIFLRIAKEGRFPRVDDIIPRYTDAIATLELGRGDRKFLVANLRRLPGENEPHADVTLDVNGRVVVRAREGESAPTELILANSRKTGEDALIATNRRYLERAAAMGFQQLYIYGNDRPMLAHDGRRTYLWMVLDKSGIVLSSPESKQVFSDLAPTRSPTLHPKTIAMPKHTNRIASALNQASPTTSVAAREPTQPLSPLDQATKLRTSLREALAAVNGLVRSIKRQKKQDRAYKTAIASLRQLQEAA